MSFSLRHIVLFPKFAASVMRAALSRGYRQVGEQRLHRILYVLGWISVFLFTLFISTLIVLRFFIFPNIDNYREDIERIANRATGLTVHIGDVDAAWYSLRPGVILKQVEVYDQNQRLALRLPEISASLSWRSLATFQIRLKHLRIKGAEVDIRRDAQGHITVAGIAIDKTPGDSRFVEWLLKQKRIEIQGARVRWNDELRAAPELPLEALYFVLLNSGHHHRFALQATPPTALASRFDIRGDFSHPFFAPRISDYTQWDGTLYANVTIHDLTAGKAYVDYPLQLDRGRGMLRAWLDFDQMIIRKITADVALEQVVTRLRHDLSLLGLQHVQGRVQVTYDKQIYTLDLKNFSLQTAEGLHLKPFDLHQRFSLATGDRPEQGEFSVSEVDLQTLASLAEHLPLPIAAHRLLRKFDPRGVFSKAQIEWKGAVFGNTANTALNQTEEIEQQSTQANLTSAVSKAPVTYKIRAEFKGLSSRSQAKLALENGSKQIGMPGFTNLSGRIAGDQTGGTLILDAHKAVLSFPGVFAEPDISMASIEGKVNWKIQEINHTTHCDIHIEQLAFANEDAAGALSGTYRYPGEGLGNIDIKGRLTRANAMSVARYLPLSTGTIRHWVEQAVQGGNSDDVQFILRGDLLQFPFVDPAQGQFRIAIQAKEGRFAYLPGWPVVENVNGQLVFERNSVYGQASGGKIFGIQLNKSRFSIPELTHPVLTVETNGQGPLQDMIQFVNESSLAQWSDRFTETIQATGTAKAEVKFELPLREEAIPKVFVNINFANNDIVFGNTIPAFSHTQGQLTYDQQGLLLHNVSANFLGGPIKLDGDARPDGTTVIRVNGQLTALGIQKEYSSPFTKRLIGSAPYSGRIVMHKKNPEIQLESSLVGLIINLPAPFRKPANETWPLRIESRLMHSVAAVANSENSIEDSGKDEIRVSLARLIQLRAQRERDQKGQMQIKRGVISVNESTVLPDNGWAANINLPIINIDEWRSILVNQSKAEPVRANLFTQGLDMLTLRANEIQIYGKKMQNVTLGASRTGTTWQANLDADQLSGYLTWGLDQEGVFSGKLTARLAKLTIPQTATTQVSEFLTDGPEDIPALDIVAEDFTLLDKRLGRLELVAVNTGTAANHTWHMQRLNLSNADATFNATGTWGRIPSRNAKKAERKTALTFSLEVNNAGKLLERFGQKDMLQRGSGKLEGEINWRGAPFTLDYPSLAGKMQMAIDKGQFVKVEPGIAKLMGVLSLQALPRRITLDFRDVFSEGFAFDTIRSNFEINNGIVNTKDFKMKGVAATVLMEGNVDLAQETQKLHLIVLPEVSGEMASLAWGLLANPAVGVATFLAQLLLKNPLAKALSFEYEVTGSWSDPNVVKLERKPNPAQQQIEGKP